MIFRRELDYFEGLRLDREINRYLNNFFTIFSILGGGRFCRLLGGRRNYA